MYTENYTHIILYYVIFIFIEKQVHSNIFDYIIPSSFTKIYLKYIHGNVLILLIQHLLFLFFISLSGRSTTLSELMGKLKCGLFENYWDFSYFPRLPNVEFVGGLQCKTCQPLPKMPTSLFFFVNFVFSIE